MPCRSLDRTILNACLARTLLQLPGVQRVSILRSGDGAADVLAAKDILLRDNGMEEQEEELVLYVPDEAQRYLVRGTQTVAAMNAADRRGDRAPPAGPAGKRRAPFPRARHCAASV